MTRAAALATLLIGLVASSPAVAGGGGVPAGAPDATIDLATREGVALVKGAWRVSDARIVDVPHRGPGPDNNATGAPVVTQDVAPHAEAADFDDSAWPVIDPTTLDARRSGGKVSFEWYRLKVTVPESVGAFETAGSTLVFEITVDDYAEVWVDGALPRQLGQAGGSVVAGFNVPNRLVIGRDVSPGRALQLAVFGINGPISAAPGNFVWVRGARLLFYRTPRIVVTAPSPVAVLRMDSGLDAIVPVGATVEKLAEGFQFTEGPVWLADGALLFSDPNANRIYRWTPEAGVAVFRDKSGYDAPDIAEYGQPGSNGLTLDAQGRLTTCEHGRRRVSRMEPDGTVTVLADAVDGKRLNSPNDLVYRSDGALYVSDPPFGLPRFHDDPRRELPYTGVLLVKDGRVRPVVTDLLGPNGLAFSPDETTLYVGNWDEKRKVVMAYAVATDGTLSGGRVFADLGAAPESEAIDGVKVDTKGNVYVSGPGGLWIYSSAGQHLGTLKLPELPANFAFGDDDGRTLYMTARTGLYRMRLLVPGVRPQPRVG
jgi:gluconolactonase